MAVRLGEGKWGVVRLSFTLNPNRRVRYFIYPRA
jgi:hypothetical protein